MSKSLKLKVYKFKRIIFFIEVSKNKSINKKLKNLNKGFKIKSLKYNNKIK